MVVHLYPFFSVFLSGAVYSFTTISVIIIFIKTAAFKITINVVNYFVAITTLLTRTGKIRIMLL